MLPVHEDAPCAPVSTYGKEKLAAEHRIHEAAALGLESIILRVGNAYGPTQRPGTGQGIVATFLDAAQSDTPVAVFGDGSQKRDYVHVTDIAMAVVELSPGDGVPRCINIGSGCGHTVNEVIEIVSAVTGRTLKVNRVPARETDVRAVVLDVSRISSLVDWRPLDLTLGVGEVWEAWREQSRATSQPA
jgi:UDP-glucose 4-epimerase